MGDEDDHLLCGQGLTIQLLDKKIAIRARRRRSLIILEIRQFHIYGLAVN
jgi:hypothetical protein